MVVSAIEVLAIIASAATGVLFVTLTGLALLDGGRRARADRRLRRRTWRAERAAFEASLELAAADSLEADSIDPALIDTSRPPADTLADLALLDARFGTHVLDVVLNRLVDAWQGQPAQLGVLASHAAATRLLHPGRAPHANTVVHDLTLTRWAPRVFHRGRPTRLDVFVELEGIRYVTAPDETALLAGSQHARHPLHLTWTLTLVTDPEIAWRLDATTDPATELNWLP